MPAFQESASSSGGVPPWFQFAVADEAEELRMAAEERRAGVPSQVTEEQERAESRGQWCFEHPDGTYAPERPEHPDFARRRLVVVPWPPAEPAGPLSAAATAAVMGIGQREVPTGTK